MFRLGLTGFQLDDAVERQSKSGDPCEQALQVRLVGDRPDDLGLAVMGVDRHPVERGGVAPSEPSLDNDPIATRRHSTPPCLTVPVVWAEPAEDHPGHSLRSSMASASARVVALDRELGDRPFARSRPLAAETC